MLTVHILPRLRWLLWLTIGLCVRLIAVPPSVADVDGVNFARALHHFDPLHQAPHLPGYPVYVAACQILSALGAPEVWALTLPGVLSFLLGAWLCGLALERHACPQVAERFILALSLLPGAVAFGGWPTSDGFGLGLLLICIGLAGNAPNHPDTARRFFAAGLVAGLVLGVRLSWWPVVLVPAASAWFWGPRSARLGSLGLLVGISLFALPMVYLLSPATLMAGLLEFGAGHFTTWGGAATLNSDWTARTVATAGNLADGMLGLPLQAPSWGGPVVAVALALAAWGIRGRIRWNSRFVQVTLLTCAAYVLWVMVGQNVHKARHLVALVPAVALALAVGWRANWAPSWVLAGALATVALPRAAAQAEPAPTVQMVQYVMHNGGPAQLQIFAGEESRVFEHLAPAYRVLRPASADVLRAEAHRLRAAGVQVLISSGAPGAETLQDDLTALATFETSAALRGPDHRLTLYRLEPGPGSFHATR